MKPLTEILEKLCFEGFATRHSCPDFSENIDKAQASIEKLLLTEWEIYEIMINKSGLDLVVFHTEKDRIVNEKAKVKLKELSKAIHDAQVRKFKEVL